MYDAYYDLPSAFRPTIAIRARSLKSRLQGLTRRRKRLLGPRRTRPLRTELAVSRTGLLHALRDKAEEPHGRPTPCVVEQRVRLRAVIGLSEPTRQVPLTARQHTRSRMHPQKHSSTPSKRISRGAALQVRGGVTATFHVGRQGFEP